MAAKVCHPGHALLSRKCTRCGEYFTLPNFVRDRSKTTGHRSCCKRCHRRFVIRRAQ